MFGFVAAGEIKHHVFFNKHRVVQSEPNKICMPKKLGRRKTEEDGEPGA